MESETLCEVEISNGEIEIVTSYDEDWACIIPIEYIGNFDMDNTPIHYGDIVEVYPNSTEHYGEKSVFFIHKNKTIFGNSYSWGHLDVGYDCPTHIIEHKEDKSHLTNVKVIGNIFEENEYTVIWNFEDYKNGDVK